MIEDLPESDYAILLNIVAILAYSIENDEPLAVKMETVQTILESMEVNKSLPELAIQETEDGYVKFGCVLVNGEENDA